jgi:cytochrome P450
LPLVGNLGAFRSDPLAFLTEITQRHGDVVTFRLGSKLVTQVNDPEWIRQILVTDHANFKKTGVLERARPVLGNGLVSSDGETHKRQRRLVQPAFSPKRVLNYAGAMTDAAVASSSSWQDGKTVDIADEMLKLTLDIVTRSLFNVDARDVADEIEHSITVVLRHFARLLTVPYAGLLSKLPLPSTREFQAAQECLDQFVYRIIAERRRSGEDHGDVLSILLSALDVEGDGKGLDDRQVRDQVMTLFSAGHETIATALAWTWYCLARHPHVESRFHEELDRELNGRIPTADDLPKLRYTRMVLAESMRLFPPVWAITRQATSDYQIASYTIPAGSIVGMSQYLVHHDSRHYQVPETFDPNRWEDDAARSRPKFSYFPFGGGPRLCIGESFSWMEGVLVLATLGQNWTMDLVTSHPIDFQPLLTLRPRHGIRVTIRDRRVATVGSNGCLTPQQTKTGIRL